MLISSVARHRLAVTCALLGGSAGLVYGLLASPRYQSIGAVAVRRNPVEAPQLSLEESKNRWVWVRDGLTLADAILTDEFLMAFIRSNSEMARRQGRFLEQLSPPVSGNEGGLEFAQALRKAIKVDYTGGDSNRYLVTATDANPEVAKALVDAALERIRALVAADTRLAYREAVKRLDAELAATGGAPRPREGLTALRDGLVAALVVQDSYADRRVQTLLQPYAARVPIWPAKGVLILAGAFLGLAFGVGFEWLLYRAKSA